MPLATNTPARSIHWPLLEGGLENGSGVQNDTMALPSVKYVLEDGVTTS